MAGTEDAECNYCIDSKIGRILIVDKLKSLQESESYCHAIGGTLAPLQDDHVIAHVTARLSACTEADIHGAVFRRSRDIKLWRIGLRFVDGVGRWTNGQVFNQPDLLPDELTAASFTDQCVYLYPKTSQLEVKFCPGGAPFLCLQNASVRSGFDEAGACQPDADISADTDCLLLLVLAVCTIALLLVVLMYLLVFNYRHAKTTKDEEETEECAGEDIEECAGEDVEEHVGEKVEEIEENVAAKVEEKEENGGEEVNFGNAHENGHRSGRLTTVENPIYLFYNDD